MRWIKASERLPEKEGLYFINAPTAAMKTALFFNGSKFETNLIRNKEIEWLDESPSPQSEQQIKEWIERESLKKIPERKFDDGLKQQLDSERRKWQDGALHLYANLLLPELTKRDEELERLKEELEDVKGVLRKNINDIGKFLKESSGLNQTIEQQKKEIQELKKEIDGWIRYKQNIDEALNSGDGVYRP